MTQWQPIETAPRDETEILLFHADAARWPYSDSGMVIGFSSTVSAVYWFQYEFDSHHIHPSPTHWMPLPQPPEDAS